MVASARQCLEQRFPEASDKATTFPPPACKSAGAGQNHQNRLAALI
jgi:hypothetical protein